MKNLVMLTMATVVVLVSLSGCYLGYSGHNRGARHARKVDYDRGDKHGHDKHDHDRND